MKTKSVKITYPAEEAAEGQPATKALSYTWKDFTYDQGKVTGWTGATGPVAKVLWTRQTSDEREGRKAVLKSAYRANNKNVVITVELSSKVATSWTSAEYTAKDGYRQVTLEEYASELSKGEKTLAYYVIEKAEFGGQLHIPYTDAEGFEEGELLLTIK